MLFKSAGHSKSDIDGLHNFPRIVAETENQYDRALNLHDLIECCKEAESDQRSIDFFDLKFELRAKFYLE